VPFVIIQVIMVGLVILFPQMVMVYKAGESTVDPTQIRIDLPPSEMTPNAEPGGDANQPGSASEQPKSDGSAGQSLEQQLQQQESTDKPPSLEDQFRGPGPGPGPATPASSAPPAQAPPGSAPK
jgi:hypothetical protein